VGRDFVPAITLGPFFRETQQEVLERNLSGQSRGSSDLSVLPDPHRQRFAIAANFPGPELEQWGVRFGRDHVHDNGEPVGHRSRAGGTRGKRLSQAPLQASIGPFGGRFIGRSSIKCRAGRCLNGNTPPEGIIGARRWGVVWPPPHWRDLKRCSLPRIDPARCCSATWACDAHGVQGRHRCRSCWGFAAGRDVIAR
jgi:hypothetical protein